MDLLIGLDAVLRETALFAAVGLAVGGVDDLAVDLVYVWLWLRGRTRPVAIDVLPTADRRIAVLIPAWDEAEVIGAMISTTLARFGEGDYRLYVGVYPNDRATFDALKAAAGSVSRVRIVMVNHPGPTTKADCLNTLWRALEHDRPEWAADAILLHDAEDVVDPDELGVIAGLLGDYAAVQLPVRPLRNWRSPLVSGHYLDEFSESHGKDLVVRTALGAGMPLAGVGCALRYDMVQAVARHRGGLPFDASSLVEDYELGLIVTALGGRSCFARVRARLAGRLVAVGELFPGRLEDAIRQKGRWMTGIALAGWDRLGWSGLPALRDHWMRMRDRRGLLAVILLAAAYLALVSWGLSSWIHWWRGGSASAALAGFGWLLALNGGFMVWRLIVRAWFTGWTYGPIEALLSVPRALVGNYVALFAARNALGRYFAMLRGGPPRWDKTRHSYPTAAELVADR